MKNALIKPNDILTKADIERIKAIIDAGTAENTRRAYAGDIRYFWAWAKVSLGIKPTYPVPVAALIRFITDHLHGLDPAIDTAMVDSGIKARRGVLKISTIQRRVASLSVAHRFKDIKDRDNPCRSEAVRLVLSKARRAAIKTGWRPDKKQAATLDVLFPMLHTCGDRLIDMRDHALLLFAWSTGGRRRSEVAAARYELLSKVADGYTYTVELSKTDQDGAGLVVPLLGKAAISLDRWLDATGICEGYLFRGVRKGGKLLPGGIRTKTVARIIKKRAEMAGIDPARFGGHSLRSGFITEAGLQGKPLGDIMALSGHKTAAVALSYYQPGAAINNSAAKLAG